MRKIFKKLSKIIIFNRISMALIIDKIIELLLTHLRKTIAFVNYSIFNYINQKRLLEDFLIQ